MTSFNPTAEDLIAIEDALGIALIGSEAQDDEAAMRAQARVQNALGLKPRATLASVRAHVEEARQIWKESQSAYFRVTPTHLESLLAAAYAAGACRHDGPMPQEEVDGYAQNKVNFLIEKGQLTVQS